LQERKPRVGSQAVGFCIHVHEKQGVGFLLVRPLQFSERLVAAAKRVQDQSDVIRVQILLLSRSLQFFEHRRCLGGAADPGQKSSVIGAHQRRIGDYAGKFILSLGLLKPARIFQGFS